VEWLGKGLFLLKGKRFHIDDFDEQPGEIDGHAMEKIVFLTWSQPEWRMWKQGNDS
jgi:hypothetical protein